jgi:PAS domain S-box-containing protein
LSLEYIYKSVFSLMESPVFVLDGNGIILCVNSAMENLTKRSLKDFSGKKALDCFKENDDFCGFSFLSDFSVKNYSHDKNFPVKIRDLNGILQDFLVSTFPCDEANHPEFIFFLLKNISREKKLLSRISQWKKEWYTTFDSINDFISIHDKDLKIIRMNKSFARSFNLPDQDTGNKAYHELIHGIKDPWPESPFIKSRETGKTCISEVFSPHLGIHVEITVTPVLDESADIMGYVHIARDISGRKKTEKELKKVQQELIQSEKMSAMGRFASGIAHEIKNPLGNIVAAGQVCLTKIDDVPKMVGDYLGIILRNAENANKIIEDLLDFARPRTVSLEPGNISTVIIRVCDSAKAACSRQNVEVKQDISDGIPKFPMDQAKLEAAFLNFIRNSLDAMPEGGYFNVSARHDQESQEVVLKFKDSGEGISPRNIDKIFEPFFTTKTHGVGLGLGMVHQIIRAHRGKISINSKLGEFTEIIVRFPLNNIY